MFKWNKNFYSSFKMYVPSTIFFEKKKKRKKEKPSDGKIRQKPYSMAQPVVLNMTAGETIDKEESLFCI